MENNNCPHRYIHELENCEVCELQQRNVELAAQVELLIDAGNEVYAELQQWALTESHEETDLAFEIWLRARKSTPTQCLAEHDREVAARAVEKAADYAAGLISDKYGIATSGAMLEILDHKTDVVLCVAEYADKIRSGEVKI